MLKCVCYHYFHLVALFPDESKSASSPLTPHPPPVLEENHWGSVECIFTDQLSFLPPYHQCQGTEGNTALSTGLASSFVHL